MSIATQIQRLNVAKSNVKEVVNQDFGFIQNETVSDYATKINETIEEYKKYIPEATVEGTELNVDDAVPIRSKIDPKGNTYQKQLSGKNLLNLQNGTYSSNGITAVVEDGKITINGTATTTSFLAIPFVYEYDGSTYSISANNENTIGNTTGSGDFASVRISGETTTQAILGNKNATKTFTLSGTKNDFTIRTGAGLTYNNFVIYPQLEIGQPTDYEPYCGGQASPNLDYPQEIEVVTGDNVIKNVGKNLFNGVVETGSYNTSTGAKQASSTLKRNVYPIKVNPNTTYIFSINGIGKAINVFEYEKDMTFIGKITGDSIAANTPFITSDKTEYINIFRGSTDGTEKWQIEEGLTPTSYEPYREEEYKLDLWKENEFDSENATVMNALLNDGGIISANGSYRTVVVSTLPDTLYKISKNPGAFFRIADFANLPQINDEYISRIKDDNAQFILFKTSHFANYLAITYWNIADTILEQEMLESIKIQQPLELCKIGDYEDILFKNELGDENYNAELEEGAWYKKNVIGKVILNGNENWELDSQEKLFSTNLSTILNNSPAICTHYTAGTISSARLNVNQFAVYISAIYFNRNNMMLQEWTNWLQSHNISVYFLLKNITYEKITHPTLISQLEALRKAKWFKGVNHWWTETDNLEPVLKGTYKQIVSESEGE